MAASSSAFPVRAVSELAAAEADALVLTTFDTPEPRLAELVGPEFPASKILTLFPPVPPADGDEQS